jgi:hypothetical protein
MAYKQKGCTPITAKIQKGTKGGITNPLLNVGVPMKKNPSMAKQTIGPENQRSNADSDISMTPYSKEKALYTKSGSRGEINGPTVSYDMAYDKAKKTKRYANTSKADYIKEAKRQTKSFKESGDWNATPKKPKAKAVSTIKSEGVKSSKPKVSTEKTPKIKMANKVAEPKTKRENRKQKAIDVKLTKAKAARASGNDRKADRKEKAAKRKTDKLDNKNSPAKNYKKGYYGK